MSLGYFWLRRFYSISGLVLSFAFLAFVIIPLSAGLGGPAAFNSFAATVAKIPLIDVFVILVGIFPLIFYAAVGCSIIYSSEFNLIRYPTYRNWMHALQMFCGLVMVAFLAYHIYAMFSLRLSGHADFAAVQRLFTTGWVRALYITGVIAAAFTAGNGAATMLSQWGITASRRANDAASMAMWIVTLVLAAWGIRVVFLY